MAQAHHRKKQPDLVRRQVLDVAVEILVERGARNLTLDAVARQAGVTKGGLIHHFPNRKALLNAMFESVLADFDRCLDAAMAQDGQAHGRFTRAYLAVILGSSAWKAKDRGVPLYIAVMADPELRLRMQDWFDRKRREHAETDGTAELELVRFAADGLWLSETLDENRLAEPERKRLLQILDTMTRKPEHTMPEHDTTR